MVLSFSGPPTRLSQQGQRPKMVEAVLYAMLRGPSHYESGQNKINLDAVICLTFVTKFYFISFFLSPPPPIWHIYIYKETTYIELKQFLRKVIIKKSQDVNRNDVCWKDL
jgi:hypothetical protein